MSKFASNRLLAALPEPVVEKLLGAATHVTLPLGADLYQRDELPRFLYFLTSGIGSVVFNSERGTTVELSTLGSEGLIGWDCLLGPAATQGDCTMQIAGEGFRVPIQVMQAQFESSADVRQRILEFGQHQLIVANQVVACNRLHRAEARFARWLLMVSDRIKSNELHMTQEFMSGMLGTRRTTVNEVSAELARSGAVEGRRGALRIIDRDALERHACECYRILRCRLDLLYARPLRPVDKGV